MGGCAVIETPTDAPFMRDIVGHEFEKFYFRYAHPWIFSEKSLDMICRQAGFHNIKIKNVQLYGLSNVLNWTKYEKPMGDDKLVAVSDELEAIFKIAIQEENKGDSMLAYLVKE